MSFPTRPISTHVRQPSMAGNLGSSGAPPAMVARVNEKKAELEDLKKLRDYSAAVAAKMEELEQGVSTLSNGTEAIALVMSNWHNVLRVINMGSSLPAKPSPDQAGASEQTALPQTLVRIPTEHAPTLQAHADAEEAAAEEE